MGAIIKQHFTSTELENGALAVKRLSKKARDYCFLNEDKVAEYWDEGHKNKLYAVIPKRGRHNGFWGDMTLDELNEYMEDWADILAHMYSF